jgi:alginate O-acetyltransferase complex protein AlgI
MLFNSFEFLIFLSAAFFLYWAIFYKNIFYRNFFLLSISYLFYGWWDWRFLFLIVFSSLIDYIAGLKIHQYEEKRKRKIFLWLSLCTNLGFLGTLKYFNFFSNSLYEAFTSVGVELDSFTLDVVLPVGISFYTFQTMSYTIDVYKRKLEPSRDIIAFFSYVSFFPQLVAGPIERAINLLPQFSKLKVFDYSQAVNGLRLILWGFFKKVVLADNVAVYANYVFNNYTEVSGLELIIGAVMFAFQIYGDFSGYSDIAIGTARLFGFELMTNFRTPFFSRDIAEFWRRWHISLSSWFRDYIYIPLGGSQSTKARVIRNIFIIFIISGFWHGANWTFIFWGALNAVFFLPLMLLSRNRNNLEVVSQGRFFPSFRELTAMLSTFFITCLAWIFFRSPNLSAAFSYLAGITEHQFLPAVNMFHYYYFIIILFWLFIDWLSRYDGFDKFTSEIPNALIRRSFYFIIILMIGLFGAFNKTEFIYFQF